MTSEWVEDAALGVAVREVGDALHVKPLDDAGCGRIDAAIDAAYQEPGVWIRPVLQVGLAVVIDAAHRLAFARALSPIGCAVESAGAA